MSQPMSAEERLGQLARQIKSPSLSATQRMEIVTEVAAMAREAGTPETVVYLLGWINDLGSSLKTAYVRNEMMHREYDQIGSALHADPILVSLRPGQYTPSPKAVAEFLRRLGRAGNNILLRRSQGYTEIYGLDDSASCVVRPTHLNPSSPIVTEVEVRVIGQARTFDDALRRVFNTSLAQRDSGWVEETPY